MKDEMNRNLFQKFTLKLKSRTEGKRLSEAKLLLKDIYPYEVDERNIYIEKSEVKGLFDVYVSREEINKDSKVKGLALLAAALLVLVTSSIFIIHHGISENENAALIQKEKEESEKQIRPEWDDRRGECCKETDTIEQNEERRQIYGFDLYCRRRCQYSRDRDDCLVKQRT